MKNIFNKNGLISYDKNDIAFRNYCVEFISNKVEKLLKSKNKSWIFEQIETSTLIPTDFVSSSYTKDDYFNIGELSLRPETTSGSYEYAISFIQNGVTPPLCVWQYGKSYRNENDQVEKNVRLKEFYQLEFQCIYSETTKNDYHTQLLEEMLETVSQLLKMECRIVESDRIPEYSKKTFDIEVKTPHKWLEVCSISLRKDFNFVSQFGKLEVAEVAFGLDRLLYCYA